MYIRGVGHTKFGLSTKTSWQLGYEAALQALEDARLSVEAIGAIVLSSCLLAGGGEHQRHLQGIFSSIFKKHIPIICTPAACAGGGAALFTANRLGFENVLVIGMEKLVSCMTATVTEELMWANESRLDQQEGLNFVAINAAIAQQYLLASKATMEDLAKISLKNHRFAEKNPNAAFFGKKVTIDEIMRSPVICSPLRLFDCSMSVDGAAALLLTKKKTGVKVAASALNCDSLGLFDRATLTSWEAAVKSAKEAYRQANLSPNKIDVAELHDAFTSVEMMAYEDLGFCKRLKAKEAVRKGEFGFEGRLPVNTSGGLKAKGHPVSATGVSQVVQLVKQLRGEAGDFQVNKPKTGLAHNMGGIGSTAVIHIIKKVGK